MIRWALHISVSRGAQILTSIPILKDGICPQGCKSCIISFAHWATLIENAPELNMLPCALHFGCLIMNMLVEQFLKFKTIRQSCHSSSVYLCMY